MVDNNELSSETAGGRSLGRGGKEKKGGVEHPLGNVKNNAKQVLKQFKQPMVVGPENWSRWKESNKHQQPSPPLNESLLVDCWSSSVTLGVEMVDQLGHVSPDGFPPWLQGHI